MRLSLLFSSVLFLIAASSGFAATVSVPSTSNTYIRDDQATTNNGSSTSVIVGRTQATTGTLRGLFGTSLSLVPDGATITSVTFTLNRAGTGSEPNVEGPVNLELYLLSQPFNETQATWNLAQTGTPWTTTGGDFTTLLATAAADPTVGTGTLTFASTPALVAAIQAAADSNSVFYMVMKLEDQFEDVAERRPFFFSSDDSTGGPSFTIEYIPEPTVPALVLSGLGAALLRRRR